MGPQKYFDTLRHFFKYLDPLIKFRYSVAVDRPVTNRVSMSKRLLRLILARGAFSFCAFGLFPVSSNLQPVRGMRAALLLLLVLEVLQAVSLLLIVNG